MGESDHADLLQQQGRRPADFGDVEFRPAGRSGLPEHHSRRGSAGERAGRRAQRVHHARPAPDARNAAVHRHDRARLERQLLGECERARHPLVAQREPVRYQSDLGKPGGSERRLLLHPRGFEFPPDQPVSVPQRGELCRRGDVDPAAAAERIALRRKHDHRPLVRSGGELQHGAERRALFLGRVRSRW